MKKILFTLLLCGFACLSLNAQKPLAKPPKPTQSLNAGNGNSGKTTPSRRPSNSTSVTPSKQPAKSGSSALRIVATGSIRGHDYVDLGLSVKWATCNVGATSPSGYGDYFAWGETSPKSEYSSLDSMTDGKNMGDIAGDSRYDAARANWGGSWRLPKMAEIEELVNKCKMRWTTYGGYKGCLVTGPNGKSIFLPAAGWHKVFSQSSVSTGGYYWSSTPNESGTELAYDLSFYDGYFARNGSFRYHGYSVRPVSE